MSSYRHYQNFEKMCIILRPHLMLMYMKKFLCTIYEEPQQTAAHDQFQSPLLFGGIIHPRAEIPHMIPPPPLSLAWYMYGWLH